MDGQFHIHFLNIDCDHAGIHRFVLVVAQGHTIVLIQRFPLIVQIHSNLRVGNLFDYRRRSLDDDALVIQENIFLIGHKIRRNCTVPYDLHGDFLSNLLFYRNGDISRILILYGKGIVCNAAGPGNGIFQPVNTGVINSGQVSLQGDIAGIDLHQIGTVTGKG